MSNEFAHRVGRLHSASADSISANVRTLDSSIYAQSRADVPSRVAGVKSLPQQRSSNRGSNCVTRAIASSHNRALRTKTMNIQTRASTEADLETLIDATLRHVFPWATDLRHQTRFEITFGRNRFQMDGARESVQGRSDIVIYHSDRPLAVLELKRPGLTLTEDDEAQGRSYALLLGAPIVVVANGETCRCFATHDMGLLSNGECAEQLVAQALVSASRAAKANLADAVATLLGSDDSTWAQVISAISSAELAELSGTWGDSRSRFIQDFLVPRKISNSVLDEMERGRHRAAIVTGPPLSGKSSVLRDIVKRSKERTGVDVLFIDCASTREGLFRRLANMLAIELGWPATPDDARNWLRLVSQRDGHRLVVALDTPSAADDVLRQEVDELLSRSFGERLKLVISLDENDLASWTMSPSGRDSTRLGRFSLRFPLVALDNEEFSAAQSALERLGGRFIKGADKALELRSPWILRTIAANALRDRPPELVAVLPPLLGIDLFKHTEERLTQLASVREPLRRLSRAYIRSLGKSRSDIRVLMSMYLFSVTEREARKEMERDDIRALIHTGIVRRASDADRNPALVVRQPELFAHCVAEILGRRLGKAIAKGHEDCQVLTCCAAMPLGDIIGAQAILNAAQRADNRLPLPVLNSLLERAPRREALGPGFYGKAYLPEIGVLTITVDQQGRAILETTSKAAPPLVLPADELDSTVVQLEPWLILARLCACRLLVVDNEHSADVMPALLLELASAPVIMRRHSIPEDELHIHEVKGQGEMACFANGIVEPITMSIVMWLSYENMTNDERDAWVEEALARNSLPLNNRLHAALVHLSHVANIATWASSTLRAKVAPAIARFSLH